MLRTSNPARARWADHYVAGHRQADGSWDLQCGDPDGECGCGWSVITHPDISDDELDVIVDNHTKEN